MNYKGFNKVNSGISYPLTNHLGNTPVFQGLKDYEDFSETGSPIPTGVGFGEQIYISILNAWHSGVGVKYSPQLRGASHQIRSEVYRFFMAVLAYYESPNPVISPNQLFDLIKLEAEGITYLKKVRYFSMLESYGGLAEMYDPEDDFYRSEGKKFKLVDLGDFFNVRYWLFFDQPDEHFEDSCFIPLERMKPEIEEEFRESVRHLLPDSLEEYIQEEEILMDVTGSSSLGKDDKSYPLWYTKQKENYFSSLPLRGKGTYIQKCPGDTRFPLTLSAPHSNSVKLIEKQMASAAAEVAWSCYLKDPNEYFKVYNEFSSSFQHFYCRDVKKDGLTKNRRLVQIVCEEFKKKHPHAPACKYFGIYDGFTLILNGVEHHPPRGVGLGMSSAITTIIQSAAFRMALNRLTLEYQSGEVGAIFYHDDAALGSTDADTLENLKDIDTLVLDELRSIVNLKKSFTADWFVLCENYSDEILGKKESYQRTLLKQIHASANVAHAKFQFQSLFRYVEPCFWESYARELVDHFGYEFYPDEIRNPHLLGGWIPAQYMGIDISLWATNGYDLSKEQQAAGLVKLEKIVNYKGKRKFSNSIYPSPISKLYPLLPVIKEEWSESYLLGMTEAEVASKFTRQNKPGLCSFFWKEQLTKRRKKYHEYLKMMPMMPEDYYYVLRDKHSRHDIIPPRAMWKLKSVSNEPEVSRLYRPQNPKFQFLAAMFPDIFSKKIIPWGVPPDKPIGSERQHTAFERGNVKYVTSFFPGYTENWGELSYMVPTKRAIFSKVWFDPLTVVSFVETATYEKDMIIELPPRKGVFDYLDETTFRLVNREPWIGAAGLLTARLGWDRVRNLDFTYFFEEIDIILRRKRAEQLLAIRQLVLSDIENSRWKPEGSSDSIALGSGSNYTDASLNDGDFFSWRTSNRNYRNWRNWYFSLIDEKLTSLEIHQTLYLQTEREDVPNERFRLDDPVCQYLFKESGGLLDENNIPVLDRGVGTAGDQPADFDIMNPGSPDPGGSEDGGLFPGW